MIQSLANLPKVKVTLSVPLLASMFNKGYKITEIAKLTGYSHQRISQVTSKHYDQLIPLMDNGDAIAAMQAKYLSNIARDKLINVLTTSHDFSKKDLIPLTAVSDRHTQQYRLLSDKSTSNVAIDSVNHNISDLEQREKDIQDRLAKLLPT